MSTEENSPTSNKLVRRSAQTLLVCDNSDLVSQLRTVLSAIGFTKITTLTNWNQVLDRTGEQKFDLILFDARSEAKSGAMDLVKRVSSAGLGELLIAVSSNPKIDDIFSLLRAGARGFVLAPFTPEIVERTIERALLGPPFCEAIFDAPDRNSALAAAAVNALDKLALAMRQGREYFSASRDIARFRAEFAATMEMCQTFCEGDGPTDFVSTFCKMCERRADGPATRIGRTRVRLKKEKEAAKESKPALRT